MRGKPRHAPYRLALPPTPAEVKCRTRICAVCHVAPSHSLLGFASRYEERFPAVVAALDGRPHHDAGWCLQWFISVRTTFGKSHGREYGSAQLQAIFPNSIAEPKKCARSRSLT